MSAVHAHGDHGTVCGLPGSDTSTCSGVSCLDCARLLLVQTWGCRHVSIDVDPTGGDLALGGPVLLTVCQECGEDLPQSEHAAAFNAAVAEHRLLQQEKEKEDVSCRGCAARRLMLLWGAAAWLILSALYIWWLW